MLNTRSQFRVVGSAGSVRVIPGNPVQPRVLASKAVSKELSSIVSPMMGGGANNNLSINTLPQGSVLYDTMLSGLVGDNEKSNYRFYRDIYSYDTTAGSAVDLMATMPFSPFQLDGCSVPGRVKTYMAAIESLNFKTLLPEMAVDHMVMGACTMTPIYRANEKRFVDMISWQAENVTVTPTPFLGIDPLITIRPDEVMRAFLTSESEYFQKLRSNMSQDILDALHSSTIELDPLSTIFLPRKSFTFNHLGTSYFRRILPLYLLEKALYRGTLIEAGRRQRAMLHIPMGDDLWEPTSEEIQAVVALFQQADFDPLGAIVGTRSAITPTELRCIAENAIVHAEGRGEVFIKDLVPKDFVPNGQPQSWVTSGLRVIGVSGEYRDVLSVQYQGERPVCLHNFEGHGSLPSTDNHCVLVLRKHSYKCVLKAVGDLVAEGTKDDDGKPMQGDNAVMVGDTLSVETLQEIIASRVLGLTNFVVFKAKDDRTFVANLEQYSAYWDLQMTRRKTISIKELIAGKVFPGLWTLMELLLPVEGNSAMWVLSSGMTFAKYKGRVGKPWVCSTYDLTMKNIHEPFFVVGEGIITKNSGGDFWKYTDITDLTLPMKMRGLGISESFLSQEASYAAMDVSLSVFTENLRTYRTSMAQRIFYGKLFPLIAYMNDFFTKDMSKEQERYYKETAALGEIKLKHKLNDATMLDMPVIHWEKALRPEVDQAHLEILATLKQNNVPVGLATWAAAGGMSAEDIIKEVKSDIELKAEIKKLTGKDPDEGAGEEFARIRAALTRGPRGLLSRGEFNHEYVTTTRTGKKKAVLNQKAARDNVYAGLEDLIRERASNPQGHYDNIKRLKERGGVPDIIGATAGPTL